MTAPTEPACGPGEPKPERPIMPEGYLSAAPKQLPWAWARVRLERSRNYWIASVGDAGTPHTRPVWGVWLDNQFYFSSGSRIRRNLQHRPEATVHLESGDECVIVEGHVDADANLDLRRPAASAYQLKYSWPMEPEALLLVRPRVAYGWLSDGSGQDGGVAFSGSATRWRF